MPPKKARGGKGGAKARGRGGKGGGDAVHVAPPPPALTPAQAEEAARIAALPVLNIAPARPSTIHEHDITDVYYYNDENFRRAIPEHERILTADAATQRKDYRYDDQAGVVDGQTTNQPPPEESIERVRILVGSQQFQPLYLKTGDEPHNTTYVQEEDIMFPEEKAIGLRKSTLMKCSSYAEEHFTFEPSSNVLKLPIRWPRRLNSGQMEPTNRGYYFRHNCDMSWIDFNTMDTVIVPWVKIMEAWENDLIALATAPAAAGKARKRKQTQPHIPRKDTIPLPTIPVDLAGKINLYNIMLHLGVPKFIQKHTIEALVKQMHQSKLEHCELDLIDITVGRFQSLSVGVLDPVINHLVGTYGFRDQKTDRDLVNRIGKREDPQNLEYGSRNAGRLKYDQDTVIVPPKLPVLAHNIRHWSGVRYRDGDARAAHVGYPLNVGKVLKYWRKSATDPMLAKSPDSLESHEAGNKDEKIYGVKGVDYEEHSTYILKNYKEYYTHIPGEPWIGEDGIAKPEGTLIENNTPGNGWGGQ